MTIWLTAGCLHKQPAPRSVATVGSAYVARLTVVKPVELKNCQFNLRLLSGKGKPVDRQTVVLHLTMTAMDMGPNDVLMKNVGGGNYVGTGTFTMAGCWSVTASVNSSAVDKTVGIFPVDVQE